MKTNSNNILRRYYYTHLINILRLIEKWKKVRKNLSNNVQNYSKVKVNKLYITQKNFLMNSILLVNPVYFDQAKRNIKSTEINQIMQNIMENINELQGITEDLILTKNCISNINLSEFSNNLDWFSPIIGSESKISLDNLQIFLDEWYESIICDFKIQKRILEFISILSSQDIEQIQGCLNYFQLSPFGDIFESKQSFNLVRDSIRSFITNRT
ncbi:uncharacterized protein CMU_005800 [Cryptosporidium muris RN66]|uniref:Uncharacterized protein n=1 Tax=Cryptosporidium muris (strain RN66) TaxID=441375 RepID=B6AHG2_CRYMR|nr:uncharacterized protein CMU_005800 [Cryptosporidium muris RN66]EEA07657.1 hypothetical protein, conserved [Cryptosporidium muris RN66]|eukprot:XP_002142006.1 hypothetical protein [Cryptosporidium muris RN66]